MSDIEGHEMNKMIEGGCGYPCGYDCNGACFEAFSETRNRLELAAALIADMEAHEGAEGFSQSTKELLAEWKETISSKAPTQ